MQEAFFTRVLLLLTTAEQCLAALPCAARTNCGACLTLEDSTSQRHFEGGSEVVAEICSWCPSSGVCVAVGKGALATKLACPAGDLFFDLEGCICAPHGKSCLACVTEPTCAFIPATDKQRSTRMILQPKADEPPDYPSGYRRPDSVLITHPPTCVASHVEDAYGRAEGGHGRDRRVAGNTAVISNASHLVRYIDQPHHFYADGDCGMSAATKNRLVAAGSVVVMLLWFCRHVLDVRARARLV